MGMAAAAIVAAECIFFHVMMAVVVSTAAVVTMQFNQSGEAFREAAAVANDEFFDATSLAKACLLHVVAWNALPAFVD